jgi:hypothetical protein
MLGDELRKAREDADLTQEKVSAAANPAAHPFTTAHQHCDRKSRNGPRRQTFFWPGIAPEVARRCEPTPAMVSSGGKM